MSAQAKAREHDVGLDDLKRDIRQLRDDLGLLSEEVLDKQRGRVRHLREEISEEGREALERAKRQGEEAWSRAKEVGDKAVKEAEHRIEERPFMSLLLIFFVGLLLGRMVDR